MSLIIAGTRDLWVSDEIIASFLSGDPDEIVSGGALGADRSGENFAAARDIPVRVFAADWSRHGRAAGPIRNREMAEYATEALVFCRAAPTPGSSNLVAWMVAFEKPVRVVLL